MKQKNNHINRGAKSTPKSSVYNRVILGVLFSRFKQLLVAGVSLVVVSSFVAVLIPVLYTGENNTAQAAPNNTLNFQARLLTNTGALVPDGNYHIEFKIYDQTSGGSLLWTETRTTGNLVSIKNGYISVPLGSVTAFPGTLDWGDDNYLTMNVGGSGGSASWNGEMAPRMLITSVPYAFRSAEATSLKSFNGANSTTLTATAPTGTNSILLPDASGTVCLQSSSACGFASLSGANTFTGVNTFSSAGTALQVTNNATIGGTLGVTGLTTASGGLTTGNGSLFTNGGATLNNTLAIGNLDYSGSGNTGSIGAAASTVDIYTNFTIAQTTAGQTITLPAPTSTTTGRLIYVTNVGSAGYNMAGSVVSPGVTMQFVWNNTTSSWSLVTSGTSGSYIQNGTSVQTANFNIQSNAVGSVTATIQGANSQTANILEVKQAGVGTAVFSISAAGDGTFSNNLTVNGNTIIGNATTDRLTLTSQLLGQDALVFQGATDDGFTTTLRVTDPTANNILTLPNETGTICTTGSVCTGYAPSATNGYVQLAPASAQADATNNASIYIDKTSATGNLLQLQRSATDVVSVSNTGQTLFRNTSNSATAFRIQRSTSDNIFTVETNNNRIKVGNDSAGSGADTTLFIVDTATTANQPTGVNGGIFYDTTLSKFRCYENGAYKDCDTGVTAVGAVSGTSTANGATITGSTLNLAVADGTNPGVVSTAAQTFSGAKTFSALLTGSAGATLSGAGISLNDNSNFNTTINTGSSTGTVSIGNATSGAIALQSGAAINTTAGAASTISTTAGALTITSAAAATWSTTAGNLTLQAGSGTVSLGTSTALTASGALGITSGGANALTLDTGGAATLSVGTANANAVSISRTGITTTVNGNLTVAETVNLNGNTTIGNATTDRLTLTSQLLGQDALVFQGATDDGFTTTLRVTDPTANNIITFPNSSGTVQLAPTSGSYIKQVPTSTAENTITPTTNSVVGLTVNGTSGTAATALAVSQPGAAAGITIASANNTATNGLSFSGTFTNLINSTNFTVSNAGAITAVGVNSGTGLIQGTGGLTVTGATSINASGANTTNIGTGTNTGAINIGNASAGALALQSGAGVTVTGGAASSFTTTSGNLTVDSAAVLNLGNTSATSITLGRTGVTTTNAGALTVSQLLTGNLGATISGAGISLNDNSNFNTTINTGTSTGTVTIGSANAGNISLQSSGTISLTGTTNINTTGTANTAIGNATGTFALTSNGGLNVSTAGALTGVSGITTSGSYTQSGVGANTLTGATTLSNTLTVQTTTATQDQIIIQAAAVGAARFAGTITNADLTAARTYTLPNASGTFTLNPTSGSYLQTIPTTTAANTVAPTTASVVGLTVNGTTNATGATALIVNQGNTTATGAAFNLTNASGVQTDGVLINRSTAGGTTTNLLNLTSTAGTATNGLTFTGTFTNLINSTNFTVSNAGAITAVGVNSGTGLIQGTGGLTVTGATSINASGATATNIGTGTNTGVVTIGNSSNAANTVTLVAGSTNGINLNAPKVESNATTLGLFTTPTTVNGFTAATSLNIGAATGIATFGNGGAYTLQSTTGQLTVQSGSGTLSFGSTTALTASGALGITSGGANALTLDTGGAATLSVGATNANALSISRAGITTTVNGVLTVAENANFNGNTTIGNATTDRLTVTSQLLGQDALVFQGATDDGFTTTLRVTDPTANNILTLPNETGTICTTGSVCTGYAPSATNGYVQFAPASAQTDATNNSSIFINKTSGTGNILQLQKSGTNRLVLTNAGNVGINSTGANLLSVNNLTTSDSSAQLAVSTGATTNKGIVVQGVAGQTANLLEFQNSTGSNLIEIDNNGSINQVGSNGIWIGDNGLNNASSGENSALYLESTGAKFYTSVASNVALKVQNVNASPTADLLQVQNSAGNSMASISNKGGLSTDYGLNINAVLPPTSLGVALVASAGNVNSGQHYYMVSYVTATGETNVFVSAPITTDGSHGRVTVTIPVSPDYRVTARKIYRSLTNNPEYMGGGLVTTINDNTTTSYVDNNSDASLTGSNPYYKENTTVKYITVNDEPIMLAGLSSTFFGNQAGWTTTQGTATGGYNTGFGTNSLQNLTSGNQNTAIGYFAGFNVTSGVDNFFGGQSAGVQTTTGGQNVAIGRNASGNNVTGSGNVTLGYYAGFGVSGNSNSNNTFIGTLTGEGVTTGSNNIALGNNAGRYITNQSNELFINSLDRTNRAGDIAGSIIYGVQNATASSQTLTLNAQTTVGYNLAVNGNQTFGSGANRTISVATQTAANTAGNNLTVVAATGNGTGVGGTLTLQGGTGGAANANGGNLVLAGGLPGGTGTKGLVVIDTPTFATASAQNCAVSCTITQANVNNNGVVLVNATAPSLLVTLPDPTILTAGRVVYVTAGLGSNDFTLVVNGGGTGNEIAMRANTTATMIWNGSDWTAAGASSSTTLQAAYNNTLTSAGGAEIVLNNTATSNGLTVRNNDSNPIIGGIFEVQTSIGSNLLSVNNNATDYANNGGAESTTFTMWTAAPGGGTVTRYTTAGDNIATGTASVSIVTGGANQGARNTLTTALTPNLKYSVSYAVRGSVNFATLDTVYSRDGTNTSTTACETGGTATTGIWTRVNCTFIAPASGITASNAIFIRQSDATNRTIYVDNLSVTVSADINHAADGSADDAGNFATNWTAAPGGGTVTRNTSTLYDTSGSAQVVTATTANQGLRNNMSINPAINTQYLVSFYARSTNTFNDIDVQYSRNGGTTLTSCVDYNTTVVSTTGFTKITCLFTTDGTVATNPDLIIRQTAGTARTFYVDALTVTLNTNNSSNVQIGGGNKGGPTTLFTLDRGDSPPIAANNDTYLGSMYYDTTTGRIQCYEADGWGACGSAPDNIVNLNPEYAGAVLNGTGVGTMVADLCASGGGLNVNDGTGGSPTLCGSGEAKNFYKWTSPQATQQTYSIYVSYQLPSTFKGFASDDTVQLTARVDNTTNAAVTYEMFRSESGTITKCGTGETAVTTSNNVWQTVGINGNESTGCSFTTASAGAFVIFKVNVKANSNANAYVSTLNFVTTGR